MDGNHLDSGRVVEGGDAFHHDYRILGCGSSLDMLGGVTIIEGREVGTFALGKR